MKSLSLLTVTVSIILSSYAYADFWSNLRDRVVDQVMPSSNNSQNHQQDSSTDSNQTQQTQNSVKYQRGTIVLPCGCNGSVQIGATKQSDVCASGVEQAVVCRGVCAGGGSQWASVCQ